MYVAASEILFEHAWHVFYLNINQLDALNFYNEFISCLYMFQAHVEAWNKLIKI